MSINEIQVRVSATRAEVEDYFGEKCPEYAAGCGCCEGWKDWEESGTMLLSFDRDEIIAASKMALDTKSGRLVPMVQIKSCERFEAKCEKCGRGTTWDRTTWENGEIRDECLECEDGIKLFDPYLGGEFAGAMLAALIPEEFRPSVLRMFSESKGGERWQLAK